MFAPSVYVNRRRRLCEQVKFGLLLFLGNGESPMNYEDNVYPFRQDSTFLYFFGLDRPGLGAVIDLQEGTEVIYGDDPSMDDIVWMGNQPQIAEMAATVGVKHTGTWDELRQRISASRRTLRTIRFLPPYRADTTLRLHRWLGIPVEEVFESASVELIQAVAKLRSVKSSEEIDELDQAVNLTGEMHLAAMRLARPGMTEQEIVAAMRHIVEHAGSRMSFPPIVTIRGETLHNHTHGNVLQSGRLFLVDAGAESPLHYAGDMTRTFPVDPKFTKEQKEVYSIALAAHEAAVAALAPGVKFLDVHLVACRTLVEGLKQIGLMQGDVSEAVAQGAHALFFPHGLGHMMGLDVHDMESLGEAHIGYAGQDRSSQFGLKSLRLARELEPGFVLTVEPGIYFIPELIDMWKAERKLEEFIDYERVEAFRGFGGIRVEENFAITGSGSRLLGKPLPKSVAEIEEVRGG